MALTCAERPSDLYSRGRNGLFNWDLEPSGYGSRSSSMNFPGLPRMSSFRGSRRSPYTDVERYGRSRELDYPRCMLDTDRALQSYDRQRPGQCIHARQLAMLGNGRMPMWPSRYDRMWDDGDDWYDDELEAQQLMAMYSLWQRSQMAKMQDMMRGSGSLMYM